MTLGQGRLIYNSARLRQEAIDIGPRSWSSLDDTEISAEASKVLDGDTARDPVRTTDDAGPLWIPEPSKDESCGAHCRRSEHAERDADDRCDHE